MILGVSKQGEGQKNRLQGILGGCFCHVGAIFRHFDRFSPTPFILRPSSKATQVRVILSRVRRFLKYIDCVFLFFVFNKRKNRIFDSGPGSNGIRFCSRKYRPIFYRIIIFFQDGFRKFRSEVFKEVRQEFFDYAETASRFVIRFSWSLSFSSCSFSR